MSITLPTLTIRDIETTLTFYYRLGGILRSEKLEENKGIINETSEKLEKLLGGVEFPEDLQNKIRYDVSRKRLIFKGIMSSEEKDKLLNLTKDDSYKKAIESLFQMSQTNIDDPDVIPRDWQKSEISYYFSDDFLNELILTHFHLQPNWRVIHAHSDVANGSTKTIKFELKDTWEPPGGNKPFSSIGGVEITLWKHGYLSALLRLKCNEEITAEEYLNLIRHPELVEFPHSNGTTDLRSGGLVVEAYKKMGEEFVPGIEQILNKLELKRLKLKPGVWEEFQCENENRRHYSRPYIGTLIRAGPFNQYEKDTDKGMQLKRFVVASARTTPAFMQRFYGIDEYLANRNVYGAGGSIVLIERRGWCVLDAEEHNPITFRLGVVETSNLVINIVDTTARARREYSREVHEEGSGIFRELNINVNEMVSRKDNNITEKFRAKIAEATSFLARARLVSPCEDMGGLLESYLIPQTARSATQRCKHLLNWKELGEISREMMTNYTAFLKTSSDYLHMLSVEASQKALKIAQDTLKNSLDLHDKTTDMLRKTTWVLYVAIGTGVAGIVLWILERFYFNK